MSDVPDQADHDALKRIERRNIRRGLPLVLSMMLVWWFADHWLQRHGVDWNLALFGTLLAVLAVIWLLERLGLIDQSRRLLQPPYLRPLMEAKHERLGRRLRWLWIVGLGGTLVADGLHLVFRFLGFDPSAPAFNGWNVLFLMLVPLSSGDLLGLSWPWSRRQPHGPRDRTRALVASQYGHTTVMLLGLAALVLDFYQPGLLPTTLPMALIAGLLVPLLSLALDRPTRPEAAADR